ncbi:putative ATP-dependent helicase C29A10.10c [Grifola frondosa]|uniref:Putative ATP-dependent helicase C29A10.10c n=1 Tax=Grifola frondosa TaxID=5627 RepID=A0A1C7M415_GRIFR|nr:putative ATP-dependent helicase C29A10.10c [Grifola frondosa]
MLRRIGPDTWEGEGPEYLHVVFNSIKDNTRYAEMLQGRQNVHKDDWYLKWIDIYVQTIGNLPVFKDILPSVLQFLCEELQHERFKEVRPTAMIVASRLLSAILLHVEKDVPSKHEGLALDVMTIHASTFVSIAFGKAFANDEWAEARTQTRKLIKQALLTDVKCTLSLASQLCSSTDKSSQLSSPIVHEQIWKNVYHEIQPGDSDGVAMLVSTLAKISHMDDFKELAFVDNFRNSHPSHQSALAGVNKALAVFRSGFLDAVARYSDLSLPSIVADLLRRADVVKHITMLMLSPVEMIQETAQALAGSAFDVEVRLDCFRALLDNYPDATLGGIMEFLQSYTQYSVVVPEACSLSQALARCLTDVIEVLCSSPSGLLLHEEFLRAHGESLAVLLPQWWRLMTKALSVIFSKTPRWAVFFNNEDMVLWMRDALIFGRDMLAQRRVIESGALVLSQRQAGPGMKLSRAGRKMVDDLQQVLLELARWLRLTDEELLHQSFALLESLLSCFKETNVRPSPAALQKLQKHVDDGRKKGPGHLLTRLDSTRRAKLEDALNAFDEDEDVQIISHVVPRLKKTAQIPAPKHASSSTLAQIRTPLEKPNQQAPVPLRKSSTKASISNYFTAHDQKKLNAESSLPQFSRQATRVEEKRSAASSTRPTKNLKTVIKDESSSTSRRSVGTSSSSEDEESEEDGDAKGLASLSKLQRTPTIKKPAERRQVKMLIDAPMGGRNRTIELRNKREDARRTQLRMKPDISGLHRTLLSWDYDYAGPYPPGDKLQLIRVPDRFVDHEQYQKIFEPLLFLECWTQLGESKEETLETYDCQITSRQFTNDYLDVDVSIAGSLQKDWSLSDVDVVLFRHPTSNRGALGKVQSYRTTPVAIQATVRFYLKGSDPGLQINTSWRVSKVLSLATLHREYAALMALPHYDLCNTILQPKITRPEVLDVSEIQQTMRGYNVNEPQARAILGSLGADGFALIQGPPGTGKTSTICGLVHLFLSRRPRSATAIHAGRTGGPADKEPVKKVLLCAPSNAAIDEIAYRLKEGVSGSGRRTIHPKVVRVGAVRSMNVSVRDVSLEYLIDQKLDANPELRGSSGEAGTAIARLRAELESVKRLRQQKLEEMAMIHDNSAKTFALEEEVKKLNKQRVNLTHQLDKMKDKQKSDSRTLDATRRKFRAEVLQEADVICSTLSGSAYEYLETYDFEMVIIDEAAQAIELSSLIPLKYGCKTCVMVGDPQQLPPTVKSLDACKFGYDQSLFVRFQRTNRMLFIYSVYNIACIPI